MLGMMPCNPDGTGYAASTLASRAFLITLKSSLATISLTEISLRSSGLAHGHNARTFKITPELFRAVDAQVDQVLRDGMEQAFATGMLLNDVIAVKMPQACSGTTSARPRKSKVLLNLKLAFEIAASPAFGEMTATRRTTAQKSPSLKGQANESAPCLCATCATSRQAHP